MFIRAFAVFSYVVTLAWVATAIPTALEVRDGSGSSQCNSGSIQCCNSVQNANSPYVTNLLDSMGVPMPPAGTQVGVTCSPLTIGGTGSGSSCTEQTVCCNGNSFTGLIVIGCSPITIIL